MTLDSPSRLEWHTPAAILQAGGCKEGGQNVFGVQDILVGVVLVEDLDGEGESASHAGLGHHVDLSAVSLDDLLDNTQAQPGATIATVGAHVNLSKKHIKIISLSKKDVNLAKKNTARYQAVQEIQQGYWGCTYCLSLTVSKAISTKNAKRVASTVLKL